MRKSLAFLILGFLLFLPSADVFAVQQVINVKINPDFGAQGVWALPVDTRAGDFYEFEEFKDFGATGVTSYTISSIANSEGPLTVDRTRGGPSILNTHTKPHSAVEDLTVTYNMKTALTKPLAVYEIWVAGGGYFNSPVINVTYPSNWKLVTHYPAGLDSAGSISIKYPQDTAYVRPVILVFAPADLGSGNVMNTVGRFTIAGDKASVKKLTSAVQKMTYLDEVMESSLGVSAPGSILLYASDLREVDVGYEAVALAARPNVILYNRDILAGQTSEVVQTVLLHEITHLVEVNMDLFKGAVYIAPWFKEGLAVFVENQGRSKIYASPEAMAVSDAFTDSHIMTPSEYKVRVEKPFDFFFDGQNTVSVWNSYTMGGVALTRVFGAAGASGMQKIFALLKDANSNQVILTQDSDRILQAMVSISGLNKDAILYPYKGSATLEADAIAAGLVRSEYSESDVGAIVKAVQKLPQYLSGDSYSAEASDETPVVTDVAPQEKPAIVESVVAVFDSFFGGKKKEVETPIQASSTLATSSESTLVSTGTPAVIETTPKESWIDGAIKFILSLFGF